jgi:Signal transduction histidine kinase
MKESRQSEDERIKRKPISWKEFAITYGVMLLLVGIQTGIIVLSVTKKIESFLQVTVVMVYWVIVAVIFLYVTNRQIKSHYDKPMRKLSEAAKKVANGDFSVYVEPVHTPEKYDYLDVMFADFNVMVQELGSIETLKNDFVANVSHEIKTPLAIIKNYTTMLKNDDLPEDTRCEYMDSIIKATDNLSSLVTNILRLNKLENQEIEANSEQYDLCRQLCDCVLNFETLLTEKNIELAVDIEDKAIITADESTLEIVWNNLLSNALKFTRHGGTVSLIQTSDSHSFTVSVSDTGCGIDSETIKHIFDKFYQGDTSHSGDGNGLGLALAYRIVEKLGGSINVKSELGNGSVFTVTIPVK